MTSVVFTDCKSCTRPISTNPESRMEAGEYGLTRGTCFVARRLEVIAVAGLLYIRGVFSVLRDSVFFLFFLFERTWPVARMRPPCLIHLSTSTSCISGAVFNFDEVYSTKPPLRSQYFFSRYIETRQSGHDLKTPENCGPENPFLCDRYGETGTV